MGKPVSAQHSDPTGTVDLQNPDSVLDTVDAIMRARFGADYGRPLLEQAIADLARAFRGDYPGLLRCDTFYHDLRHALDSGLAMARILDGKAIAIAPDSPEAIDGEHALLGILLAFYHDIGLLRHLDEAHIQGAELTPIHEARGVVFMRDYLSRTTISHLAEKANLIMVTRLDWHIPADMPALERSVGSLLGAADLMCQMADRRYLEKCRDFLFAEFITIGLAGAPDLMYPDPETLLRKTPGFYIGLARKRIEIEYGGADGFMKFHFGGVCPYQESIDRNFKFLDQMLANKSLANLKRQPERVIDAKV